MFKYCQKYFRFSSLTSLVESVQVPELCRIPREQMVGVNVWATKPFKNDIQLPIYQFKDGQYSGKAIKLEQDCFNQPLRRDIVHRLVRYTDLLYKKVMQATQTMSDVAASGKKVLPQKKTGKARQGHRQRPGRYKGIKAHGRKMRTMRIQLPRKVRIMGLKIGLTAALYDGRVIVIDSEQIDEGKTKKVLKCFEGFGEQQKPILLVTGLESDKAFNLGVKNIKYVNTCTSDRVNILKLLRHKTVMFTQTGLEELQQFLKERTDRAYFRKTELGVFQERKNQLQNKQKIEVEREIYDPSQPLDLKFKVLREYLEDFEKLKQEGKLDEYLNDMPKTRSPGRINSV